VHEPAGGRIGIAATVLLGLGGVLMSFWFAQTPWLDSGSSDGFGDLQVDSPGSTFLSLVAAAWAILAAVRRVAGRLAGVIMLAAMAVSYASWNSLFADYAAGSPRLGGNVLSTFWFRLA
jgi:hypothetical protein